MYCQQYNINQQSCSDLVLCGNISYITTRNNLSLLLGSQLHQVNFLKKITRRFQFCFLMFLMITALSNQGPDFTLVRFICVKLGRNIGIKLQICV